MVNQALGLVLGLVSWKPERQSNTQERFASTARRAVLPPAQMQFRPRVVLVYSCEMKKKKKVKPKPFFLSLFGKFCSANPLSAVVLLSLSNPEPAW